MADTALITDINNNERRERALRDLAKTFMGIEKPLKGAKKVHNLTELISELHRVFDSDNVNIEYVNHLMLSYQSNPADWRKFAKFDRYRYTRNLVDAGNGKFNLMILCWGEGHGSAIHDHSDSHCFMKMLKGQLSEIRFAWPNDKKSIDSATADISIIDDEMDSEYDGNELQELSRSTMEENGVCYINDTLGLHRVENPSHTDVAVSLHLYCPPFGSCSIFNKKTGRRSNATVTFWSKFGERDPEEVKKPEDN